MVPLHHFITENHQEGEQIIFMDIRVFLNANNLTETDVLLMSQYFGENRAQLTVYCRFPI